MPKNLQRNSNANSLSISHAFEILREFLPAPSRIPKEKWQEILEDEHISYIVDSIREEIVQLAADAICEGYFRRAIYGFITNCAYEAWMRVFQWVHLKYDNQEISSSMSDIWMDKTPPPVAKEPQLPRKVPTVYGRLEKLMSARKSPTYCETSDTRSTLRSTSKRLNKKIQYRNNYKKMQ